MSYVFFTALALLIAIAGYDLIHRAQRFLSFPLIVLLLFVTIGALVTVHLPAGELAFSDFRAVPFLTQFAAAAAYQLSWAIYVSDYSRYLPPTVPVRSTFWWTYGGTFLGGAWVMLLGAVAAVLNTELDVIPALRSLGDAVFPGVGAVLLVATLPGLVTISGLNFYGGSLTVLSIVDSFKQIRPSRRVRIVALVLIAVLTFVLTLAASADFLTNFSDFLALLFLLFTPWTAINLVDFYVVRHTTYSISEMFNPRGLYGRWSWRGLLAYAIGFAVEVPFTSTGWYTGPIAHALGGMDLTVFIGLPVSAAAYLLACRSLDTTGEARLAAETDADLPA